MTPQETLETVTPRMADGVPLNPEEFWAGAEELLPGTIEEELFPEAAAEAAKRKEREECWA